MHDKILITGATGNVGRAILKHINTSHLDISAGVRDIDRARRQLNRDDISYVRFDIEDRIGFEKLNEFSGIFLIRPPQIANVPKYFQPLIERIASASVSRLVFLSVQGAEKMSYIPHSKIEKLIADRGLPYVFLRPSYFMDNLLTTLADELRRNKRIYLPSGRLRFNWINVDDIGKAAAKLFMDPTVELKRAYTLTNVVNYGFAEIVQRINALCGTAFRYVSPDPFSFIYTMRKRGKSFGYIGVLLLLHFLPRFGKEFEISADYPTLTGESPHSIDDFILTHINIFQSLYKEAVS